MSHRSGLKYSLWFSSKAAARSGRAADRVAVDEMVEVRKNKLLARHSAFLRDVSVRGARISCELDLAVGERLSLIVQLSEMASLEFFGRVVHARPSADGPHSEYGIEYLQLQQADIALLELYVASRRSTAQRVLSLVRSSDLVNGSA